MTTPRVWSGKLIDLRVILVRVHVWHGMVAVCRDESRIRSDSFRRGDPEIIDNLSSEQCTTRVGSTYGDGSDLWPEIAHINAWFRWRHAESELRTRITLIWRQYWFACLWNYEPGWVINSSFMGCARMESVLNSLFCKYSTFHIENNSYGRKAVQFAFLSCTWV